MKGKHTKVKRKYTEQWISKGRDIIDYVLGKDTW